MGNCSGKTAEKEKDRGEPPKKVKNPPYTATTGEHVFWEGGVRKVARSSDTYPMGF
jgi:hypothetical protein